MRIDGIIISRVGRDSKYISSVVFLYNAYVRSHLEYGSTVWNPFEKKKIGYHRF